MYGVQSIMCNVKFRDALYVPVCVQLRRSSDIEGFPGLDVGRGRAALQFTRLPGRSVFEKRQAEDRTVGCHFERPHLTRLHLFRCLRQHHKFASLGARKPPPRSQPFCCSLVVGFALACRLGRAARLARRITLASLASPPIPPLSQKKDNRQNPLTIVLIIFSFKIS